MRSVLNAPERRAPHSLENLPAQWGFRQVTS